MKKNSNPKIGGKLKDQDMISRLPNEVVGIILSFLTLREATRTCVLSHRWERLWYLYNGSFAFDFMAGPNTGMGRNHEHDRSKYIDWVNKVLTSIDGNNHDINEFILSFCYNQVSKSHIDRWVAFAFKRRVQKVYLDMKPFYCDDTKDKVPYTFPVELFRSGLYTISALTSLRLKDVHLSGELFEYFLSSCPRLERLCLCSSNQLINLRVIGAAATFPLKYLEIYCCSEMEYLEVSAPNLVSFTYFGQKINLQLAKNPKLLDVSIGCKDIMNSLLSFSSYFTQIESLKLSFTIQYQKEFTQCLKFPRLKHLRLRVIAVRDDSLLGWTKLIGCCPLLHKFTLEILMIGTYERKLQEMRGHLHENLKVVEVVGFKGSAIDMELLMQLLKTSPALEKLIVNCRRPPHMGKGCWESNLTTVAEKAECYRRAQQLKRKLPPNLELVLIK